MSENAKTQPCECLRRKLLVHHQYCYARGGRDATPICRHHLIFQFSRTFRRTPRAPGSLRFSTLEIPQEFQDFLYAPILAVQKAEPQWTSLGGRHLPTIYARIENILVWTYK